MELFKLSGSIFVDSSEANKSLQKTSDKAEETGSKFGAFASKAGDALGTVGKAAAKLATKAATAAAAGTVALTKGATEAYAEYEQLVGGLETIFEDLSYDIEQNANHAFATTGLSANEYMDTVMSFSASLTAALKENNGNIAGSAEIADTIVSDMADNANKMGTGMESIQNAYAGFAKGNFSMLDNLKLGYGGSKSEMERLLATANEINAAQGVMTDYSINNFADIAGAIHVVQNEMGITGSTADEIKSTIEGSTNAMKSAWSNFVAGLGKDGDNAGDSMEKLVDNLVESVGLFVDNVVPRIQEILPNIVDGITQLVEKLLPELVPILNEMLPVVIETIMSMADAVLEVLPGIVDLLVEYVPDLIIQLLPVAIDVLLSILDGIIAALPEIIQAFMDALPGMLDQLITGFVSLVMLLIENVDAILSPIVEALPDIIVLLVNALMENLPALIGGLVSLVMQIVMQLPAILEALWFGIVEFFSTNFSAWWEEVKASVIEAATGLWEKFKEVWMPVVEFFVALWDDLKTAYGPIVDKIKEIVTNVATFVKDTFQKVKDFFKSGINSILGFINGLINGIVGGVNTVIRALNRFQINVPAWVTKLTGLTNFGFNIAELSSPQIPLLAKGGELSGGAAIVGEDGPELLQTANSRTRVTPLNDNNNAFTDLNNKLDELLGLLRNGFGVRLDSGAMVGQLAPAMDKTLGRMSERALRRV